MILMPSVIISFHKEKNRAHKAHHIDHQIGKHDNVMNAIKIHHKLSEVFKEVF